MDRVKTLTQHLTAAGGAAPAASSASASASAPGAAARSAATQQPQRGAAAAKAKKTYRYTRDGGLLTEAERDFYEENGYLVVDDLFTDAEIDAFTHRFIELCRKPELRAQTLKVMRDISLVKQGISADDERVVTKIWDYFDDAPLYKYCQNARLHRALESFVGTQLVSSHLMVIHKPTDPGEGTSRHPLHQDHLYFPWCMEKVVTDPARGERRALQTTVASWTAMQDVTRDNGCLVVVPGSHKTELLAHVYPDWVANNHSYIGIDGVTSAVKYVHLPMKKGQTVIFHPLLWHGSGRNTTKGGRLAISCHWVSADAHFVNVTRTIQEPLEAEQRDMARIIVAKLSGLKKEDVTPEMLESFTMALMWEPRMRIARGDKFLDDIPAESSDA